jgi:hypothetical protein
MPSVCTLLEPIALFSKRIGTEELASGAFDAEGPFDNHGRERRSPGSRAAPS